MSGETKEEREKRLADALRANLRRRKDKARGAQAQQDDSDRKKTKLPSGASERAARRREQDYDGITQASRR